MLSLTQLAPRTFHSRCDWQVARHYMTALDGFWFNLVTSVPFGWLDWAFLHTVCTTAAGPGSASYSQNLAVARTLKPLRALKLVRVLRATSMWSSLLVRLGCVAP